MYPENDVWIQDNSASRIHQIKSDSTLAPYTTVFPKPLMPIGDMSILEVVLRQLKAAGIDHVTMAVGHLAELL